MPLTLAVTVACAVLLLHTGQNTQIKGDAAIAMVSVGALAMGYLLIHLLILLCKILVGNSKTLELHRADAGCAIASLKNISKMSHSADEN